MCIRDRLGVFGVDGFLSQLNSDDEIVRKGVVQSALKAIKDATQKAYQYADSVDDLMWWFSQSKILDSAFNEIKSNNPDLKPLQELLDKIKEMWIKIEENFKGLKEACSDGVLGVFSILL